MVKLLTAIIRIYQCYISPFMPRCCKYTPSCSQYAVEAIEMHGVVRGCFLGAWRILRCNPFVSGGYDPVPLKRGMTQHCDHKGDGSYE